ncbi:MAG: ATP-binding protein [Terracidiphilus sp.]|jgi:two-component system phosphate regulon sensor histidine kinase PhoR
MNRKIFFKLLGLFLLILLFQAAAMEFVVLPFIVRKVLEVHPSGTDMFLGNEPLWSGLIALAVALALAVWVAGRITSRLEQLVVFARRIAEGDLTARLGHDEEDEFHSVEAALNQAAERLSASFAEIESRRHELVDLLDSLQEAVVAITPEGLVRWSNAVMQRIAGTEIRVGRPLVHSVRDPELLACIKKALEQRVASCGRATTLTPGLIFEVNAVPMTSGGALVVLHDVTQIEMAEKSRRDFIANVSHELRTPLTSIQGYVETLVETRPKPETTREFLGIILKNATRMNRITQDLLALAGVESPDYKLALQPTRASALLQDAIDSLGGIVADSGATLELAGASDCLVLVDADAMNQVFGNLVENAVRYGKAGKRILVGARLLDSEVEFSVRDFGPGIASEHLTRIFERFYRVDKARSRESGGTGLGLAIVKHIVLAHRGRIWAESELGRGATFRFTLPLYAPVQAPQAQLAAADGN